MYDDGEFDHYECCIVAAIIDNLGERLPDCPLVPVPSHGRRIDADALIAWFKEWYDLNADVEVWQMIQMLADEQVAPTIIPAEEETAHA